MILQIGQPHFSLNHHIFKNAVIIPDVNNLNLFSTAQLSAFQLILIIQNHPDQYSASTLNQLLKIFPLTPIRVIYGPWSEGDGRNRQYFPHSIRIPWYLAESEVEKLLQKNQTPLPLTASREEIFRLQTANSNHGTLNSENSLSIITQDKPLALALRESLLNYFPQTIILSPGNISSLEHQTPFVIYDLDIPVALKQQDLPTLENLPPGQLLYLSGFPHEFSITTSKILPKTASPNLIQKFFHQNIS